MERSEGKIVYVDFSPTADTPERHRLATVSPFPERILPNILDIALDVVNIEPHMEPELRQMLAQSALRGDGLQELTRQALNFAQERIAKSQT